MTPGFPSAATYPVQAMFFDGVSNRMLASALAAAKGSAVTAVAIESAAIVVIFIAGFLIVYGSGVRYRWVLIAGCGSRSRRVCGGCLGGFLGRGGTRIGDIAAVISKAIAGDSTHVNCTAPNRLASPA